MNRIRIGERTLINGDIRFVIQLEKKRLFSRKYYWEDSRIITNYNNKYTMEYDTLKAAERNLYLFDGTKQIDKQVKLI